MKISEVSEKYNIPADTLRYYEKFGLIDNVSKISGVRNYSEEDCSRIEFIICMKHAGLSLEDIKTFINLNKEGDKTIPARLEILEHLDLMDAEGPDLELDIPNGKILKKNYVGKNLANYDSMLVLSHFKGHAMGGYGGALKQLSIGCASSAGKTLIHTAGVTDNQYELFNNLPEQDHFLEAMADAASSVVNHFNGNIVYINVMKNISVDCDCDGNASAPCMADVGILASLDPVAIDQACLDLVYNSTDPGKDKLIERIESLHGVHTVEAAAELGVGSREYELITIE